MKYKVLIMLFAVAFASVSCVDDETSDATRPLSEISIVEGSVKEVYNISKNETLTIIPQIVQTNKQKQLSYTWEIELETYSNEEQFVYTGNELGSFKCRLIVENEDGKTFFPFTLNVNTPYEEGITVISKDKDGKSHLAFMLTPTDESVEPEFTSGDCFGINNPDIFFASNPTDIIQSSGSLIISCQGAESGDAKDVATIYYLNEKTLVVENMLTAPEYPDFKPTRLAIPTTGAAGVAYPILCENGNVYEFSTTEGAIAEPVKLQYNYAQSCVVNSGKGYYYDLLFWDKPAGALCLIYNGYGPYYCSKKYNASREDCLNGENYFNGRSFLAMTLVRMTEQQKASGYSEVVVLTNVGVILQKTVLCTSFHVYNSETASTVLYDNGGSKMCGIGVSPITESTPCIANKTYYSLLFGKGNKVMRWNYTSSQLLTEADELLSVGSEQAVITGFEISADHKETYVAFYEPQQEGLNGSVWVFDTDKGDVLRKYDNVCYQPVKIMYKKK